MPSSTCLPRPGKRSLQLQHQPAEGGRRHLELGPAAGEPLAGRARDDDLRHQSSPFATSSAARTFGGDIGRSVMRSPIASRDRVGDRRHRRDDRHLADAARAERMARVRHLDQDRLDHRQVGGHRAAVVEEARVIHLAVLVVDVLLVQRPADALRDAALDLALDVARVDRAADILHRGVAQDRDLAGLRVDLDVADMRAEAGRRRPARSPTPRRVIGPPVRAAFSAISASDSGSNAPTLVPAG